MVSVKVCFHYGCALRCVAGDIETPIVYFLFLSPRNATRSRNGNKPLLYNWYASRWFGIVEEQGQKSILKTAWQTADNGDKVCVGAD